MIIGLDMNLLKMEDRFAMIRIAKISSKNCADSWKISIIFAIFVALSHKKETRRKRCNDNEKSQTDWFPIWFPERKKNFQKSFGV